MPAYRRASVREITKSAYEMDGRTLEGHLRRDPTTGQWAIGGTLLTDWLAQNEGQEVVLLLLSLSDDRPLATKVCRTCGREYTGFECAHCREVRLRLRGR